MRQALEEVPGVKAVTVPGWRSASATIETTGNVRVDDLTDAVAGAGYHARPKGRSGVRTGGRSRASRAGYQLAIIGTGGGGMAAAVQAAELGARVAIIESGTIGGTCVNIGCVPSKALTRAAHAYHSAGHHGFPGVHTKAERIDWAAVVAGKDEMVSGLRQHKYVDVLNAYGESVRLVRGRARLIDQHHISVDGEDPGTLEADKVIIATGATPFVPPIDGIGAVDVLTSRTVMEVTSLPSSLIVLGGRAVALELGQAFARFGTRVTVVQRSARLLPDHEPEVSGEITRQLRKEGIEIITGAEAQHVQNDGSGVSLTVSVGSQSKRIHAERILAATGVRPRTQDLGLEELGVKVDGHGFIEVDAAMQSTAHAVFAVGDVTNMSKHVYLAAAAGRLAARNALSGNAESLDTRGMADVVFTDPQVARVGLTEEEARQAGYRVKTTMLRLEQVPRAITARDTRGGIKLVADEQRDLLLGAHLVAAEGGEIIQVAAMAIRFGITIAELRATLVPYLTQAEGLKLAAQTFDKDVALLSCCA